MKMLLSVVAFAFIAPALAHAVDVQVYGKCGESVLSGQLNDYATASVFEVTTKVCVAGGLGAPKTNKENNYVTAIGELGEKEETVGNEKLLWGWGYKLNGVESKESPMVLEVPYGSKNKIEWIYGYVKMNVGKTACTEGEECPFHAATAADCEKKPVITEVSAGSLSGKVVNAAGAAVEGATISASRITNGMKITEVATTDDAGSFNLPSIISATYTVTVRAPGYFDAETTGVVVSSDAPATVTLTVKPFGLD